MQIYGKDKFNLPPDKHKTLYSLSNTSCIILFLIGWLGFQAIGYLVELIFLSFVGIEEFNANISLQAYFQMAVYLVLFAIIVSCFYLFDRDGFIRKVKTFKQASTFQTAIIFLGLYYLLNFAYSMLQQVIINLGNIQLSPNNNQSTIETLLSVNPIPIVITTVILAPICEELTYRQGLYEVLSRKNENLAIILTTLIFSLIHVDIIGICLDFSTDLLINELLNFPAYLLAGIALSLAYKKHHLVTESISMHFMVNLISTIILLLENLINA